MQSATYPFNPNDWATVTPLFEALSVAPVADGAFLDWLAQWNDLDIAVWDAYTQLKLPAYYDTSDQNADAAYQGYVVELFSTYLRLTNTLMSRALSLHPEPPMPTYQQLWRRWRNQTTLFDPSSLPIQAEISRLEGRYREIMRGYESDPDSPLTYWIDRRDELNDLMMQLLNQRRALAQASGEPTFLAYRWRELNRLDYSIADCQAFHRAVEKMVPAISEFRSEKIAQQAFPEVDDPALLTDGVERILHRIDPAFGAIFHSMRDGYLDLDRRRNKADSYESWFFPRAGMPYIHIASPVAGSVLHEVGHGIHDYLSFQAQGSLWNFNGPEIFQEFVAMSMDRLSWSFYEKSQDGPYSPDEAVAARVAVLQLYLGLTDSVMRDAFEHWVYGEAPADVTPADLDAKWIELKKRYEPWDIQNSAQEEAEAGWQPWNWSLFRIPLYMITYPMAVVGACQVGRLAETDRAVVIGNFKRAMALGNTRSLPDLFDVVGLTFPFTDQAVAETVQDNIAQSLAISNSYR